MFRLFLILFLCVVFSACSSDDDSEALNEWFKDRGIASSYSLQQEDIDLSVKSVLPGADVSAFLVSSSAALGKANGIEQSLYFGLKVSEALSPVWKLRIDTVFYRDFHNRKFPDAQKTINAKFCWLKESETQHDTTWLKFSVPFTKENCKPIKSFQWKAGASQDTFSVSLPDEFLNIERNADTLRLLAGLFTDNAILRIAPPTRGDIPGLLRVAQITKISDECKQCLHAGVRESLSVAFEIKSEDRIKIDGKQVVFAELILPKSNGTTSELGHPVPVYVYSSNGSLEDYRVDIDYVNNYKHHPNLVFWEGDSLRLQVTQGLRNYVNAANSQDILEFSLRLGTPMLIPESLFFYNLRTSRVFSDRFAFASYDFGSALAKPVKLRLWIADFGDKK
jgi:hypothetical protein